jgi:hypothetical protein
MACHFAGNLPAQWVYPGSALSANMSYLDLSGNRLDGSIPSGAGGSFTIQDVNGTSANLVLAPMNGSGLCGPIPGDLNVTSATKGRLQGSMPAGDCPGMFLFCIAAWFHSTDIEYFPVQVMSSYRASQCAWLLG